LRHKAHFCAISSTSGTGTEVTAFSIVTDYQVGIKYPIADFQITPDMAIVDPDLVQTLPPKLVAFTGIDALTHAIEAYVSTAASAYTDALAVGAAQGIRDNLVKSYNGDKEARAAMHDAQCMAGMAFSVASLGIVHSMAHKTGAAFGDLGAHIIHGAANAMYLPKVIHYNAKDGRALKRYGALVDELGLGGANDAEKVENLIQFCRGLSEQMNVPHAIKNYGLKGEIADSGFVPEDVFKERLSAIAANALLDACTATNPRKPTQDEMEQVLNASFYDREVTC
jgi:alcohol dehydrogenase class IV